jgi:hypothetical protein
MIPFSVLESGWCLVCSSSRTIRYDGETAVVQSPLLVLCHASVTIIAASVILLLATVLLVLFSSVNVRKIFVLTSCQHGSIALKDRSVHGLATVCSCQLEINLEQAVFLMYYF